MKWVTRERPKIDRITQYDPISRHISVNVQSRRQSRPFFEPQRRLAFIACEDNDRLLVFDLQTRKITSSFDVGKDPDVLAYDARPGLLHVAAESGIGSLFRLDAAGLVKVADGSIGPNAHVVAVDPDTHRAYFPIKDLDGHPVLRIVQPEH